MLITGLGRGDEIPSQEIARKEFSGSLNIERFCYFFLVSIITIIIILITYAIICLSCLSPLQPVVGSLS